MELEQKLKTLEKIESVIDQYSGNAGDLYHALGAYVAGEHLGWQTLRITLGRSTYAKYQRILGVDFKEIFPKRGVYSRKSVALSIVDSAVNAADYFWDVVNGVGNMDKVKRRTLEVVD